MLKPLIWELPGLNAQIALKDKGGLPFGRKNMKSAKLSIIKALSLIALMFSLILSLIGCQLSSFTSGTEDSSGSKGDSPSSDETQGTGSSSTPDEPKKPLFYNRYTGLACDETLSSCRPVSICTPNSFQGSATGLSYADILIEAPTGDSSRLFALITNWKAVEKVGSIGDAKDYMLSLLDAFESVSVTQNSASDTDHPSIQSTDQALSNFFFSEGERQYTSGSLLLNAAESKKIPLTHSASPLPFVFSATRPYIPSGNSIQFISYSYTDGKTVSFSYDSVSDTYLRAQNGMLHTDAYSGTPLTFTNVILLFHNVNYYHTPDGTSYTIDAHAGGSGFCYTGGGVVSINWGYDGDGVLRFTDSKGAPLTLNPGKTAISMLRVTDSTTVVAK